MEYQNQRVRAGHLSTVLALLTLAAMTALIVAVGPAA
jgi:hypothetical protein